MRYFHHFFRIPSSLAGRGFRRFIPTLLSVFCTSVMAHAAPSLQQIIPTGCKAPPTTYNNVYSATPATLSTILNAAEGGDIIYLATGNYGALTISGANSSFLSIVAGPGQTPQFLALGITGARWLIQGLTISSLSPPGVAQASDASGSWQTHPALVNVASANNVIFEGNTIESQPGTFPWTQETEGVADPNATSSGIEADNVWCMTIYGNTIRNVFNGVQIGGDQHGNDGMSLAVVANSISDFAADAIDHYGSRILIQSNTIFNAHDICSDQCIHNDGIQGWNWQDQLGITNTYVTIDSNTIIVSLDPSLVLPADDLHGISIFDGFWTHVTVTNNIVINGTWNGIAIGGVNTLQIMNNTVVALPSTGRMTWIQVGSTTHEGGTSNNTTVRNNIAPVIINVTTGNTSQYIVEDHNTQTQSWSASQVASLFNNFDTTDDIYNLNLQAGTVAVGSGSSVSAPALDITGATRKTPYDLGAYMFNP